MYTKYFRMIFDYILHSQVRVCAEPPRSFFINSKCSFSGRLPVGLCGAPTISKSGRRREWEPGWQRRGRPEVCSPRTHRRRRRPRPRSSVVWRSWRWPEQQMERNWPRRSRQWGFFAHLEPRCRRELSGDPEEEREKRCLLITVPFPTRPPFIHSLLSWVPSTPRSTKRRPALSSREVGG